MKLNDGTDWEPLDQDVIAWTKSYPAVDVYQELRSMESWLDANPTKRKTARGVKRFVNSWLARAQNAGGSSPFARNTPGGKATNSSRDRSTLDDLTDVSWLDDDPELKDHMKRKFLHIHGQYFDNDGRHTT